MTRELMSLAGGKIILVLEGGYDLPAICDCTEMCVMALLGEELPGVTEEELNRSPNKPALETLESTINIQSGNYSVFVCSCSYRSYQVFLCFKQKQ